MGFLIHRREPDLNDLSPTSPGTSPLRSVLDSACSFHICGDELELINVKETETITFKGIGETVLDRIGYHPKLQLQMYVLNGLGLNLISEPQLHSENKRKPRGGQPPSRFETRNNGTTTLIHRNGKHTMKFICDDDTDNLKILDPPNDNKKRKNAKRAAIKTPHTPTLIDAPAQSIVTEEHVSTINATTTHTPQLAMLAKSTDPHPDTPRDKSLDESLLDDQIDRYNRNNIDSFYSRMRRAELTPLERRCFFIHQRDHAGVPKLAAAMDKGLFGNVKVGPQKVTSTALRSAMLKLQCKSCVKLHPRLGKRGRYNHRRQPDDDHDGSLDKEDPYPNASYGECVHMDLFFTRSVTGTDAYLISVEHTTGEIKIKRLSHDPLEETDKSSESLSAAILSIVYRDYSNNIITNLISVDNENIFTSNTTKGLLPESLQVKPTTLGYSDAVIERAIRTVKTRAAKILDSLRFELPLSMYYLLFAHITECDAQYTNARIKRKYPQMDNPSPYEIRHGTAPVIKGHATFGDIVAYTTGYTGVGTDLQGSRRSGIVMGGTGVPGDRNRLVWCAEAGLLRKAYHCTHLVNGNDSYTVTRINAKAREEHKKNLNATSMKSVKIWKKKPKSAFIAVNSKAIRRMMKPTNDSTSDPCTNSHHAYGFLSLAAIKKGRNDIELAEIDEATATEFDLFHRMETYTVMDKHCMEPAIPAHAQYKLKNGKFRARIVAGGDKQDEAEYASMDNAARVSNSAATNIALIIAAQEGRHIQVMDVPGAYLHTPLEKPVYMEFNGYLADFACKRYPEIYARHRRGNGNIRVKLRKALYGLKEAGKLWNNNLSAFLISEGFTRSKYDQAVFFINNEEERTTINLHVDDLLVTSNRLDRMESLDKRMSEKYGKMKVQEGNDLKYIGCELNIKDGRITVTQRQYTDECLKKFNLSDKPEDVVQAPYQTGTSNAIDDLFKEHPESPPIDQKTYLSYLMSLMYLATNTRPDILLPVSVLATRASKPNEGDLKQVFQVARYINGTKDLGIVMSPNKDMQLTVYADASHGIHDNTVLGQRKGHGGYVMHLGGSHVVSKSNKMKIVTDSSTSSELYQLHLAVKEAQWAKGLLGELGIAQHPVTIYQDNKSTITIAERIPGHKGATKHIQVKFFYIHEAISSQDIRIEYKPTQDMLADFYTKPQQSIKHFCYIRDRITGVHPSM
jgi:hypothetical protein